MPLSNDNGNDDDANVNTSDPSNSNLHWDDKEARISLLNPTTDSNELSDGNGNGKGLHGSTKTTAKRRLVALKRILKEQQQHANKSTTKSNASSPTWTTTVVSPEILPVQTLLLQVQV
jgi:hypothetical protein